MQEFLARIKPKQKKYFTSLRTTLLALPETQESIEIDELNGDWCPAYRVKGSDLAWVHFDNRLWVGVPLEPSFEKKVFQDENLDSGVVEKVRDAEPSAAGKWAELEVTSDEELEQIVPLLKLRHSILIA